MRAFHSFMAAAVIAAGCFGAAEIHAQSLPVAAVVDARSVNVSHIAKNLNAKINTALSNAGVHSEGEEGLYLVGELIPVREETVETGMRKIQIREYELSLRLEQPLLNHKFGQTVIPLKGSGTDATKAAMDAVRQFNPTGSAVQQFIKSSVDGAHQYYLSHIDAIIDKAEMLARSGDYDAAITLLWACPNSLSIHDKVYNSLSKIYLSRQNHDCAMLMKEAENAFTLKDYREMNRLLSAIDADSQCAAEASALAKKAAAEIRKDEKAALAREERAEQRAYEAAEKENQRSYNLERQRINAISSIAREYLRSHRTTYHYHFF